MLPPAVKNNVEENESKWKYYLLAKLPTIAIIIFISLFASNFSQEEEPELSGGGRKLQELLEETCESSFDNNGGFVLYMIGVIYMFFGIAVVCEEDFRDALLALARNLALSPDVAGATFMAAGTSSPELFASLVALGATSNDIGSGTVVGSVVFNLLVIIGSTIVFAGSVYTEFLIDWTVMFRDSFWNAVSFIFLVGVFFDEEVTWFEALIGCILYVLYVFSMVYNKQILAFIKHYIPLAIEKVSCGRIPAVSEGYNPARQTEMLDQKAELLDDDNEPNDAMAIDLVAPSGGQQFVLGSDSDDQQFPPTNATVIAADQDWKETSPLDDPPLDEQSLTNSGSDSGDESNVTPSRLNKEFTHANQEIELTESQGDYGEFHAQSHPLKHRPETTMQWIITVVLLPYKLLFWYTIPEPTEKRCKYMYIASFSICLAWLGLLTYLMIAWTTKLGCIVGIPEAIMGATLLAVGTSTPDCLTSIAVAKTGQGTMAVSNALGSNIFDILLALSLPWLLKAITTGHSVNVKSDTIIQDALMCAITLLIILVSMRINKWKLDRRLGYIYFGIYAAFLVYLIVDGLLA